MKISRKTSQWELEKREAGNKISISSPAVFISFSFPKAFQINFYPLSELPLWWTRYERDSRFWRRAEEEWQDMKFVLRINKINFYFIFSYLLIFKSFKCHCLRMFNFGFIDSDSKILSICVHDECICISIRYFWKSRQLKDPAALLKDEIRFTMMTLKTKNIFKCNSE